MTDFLQEHPNGQVIAADEMSLYLQATTTRLWAAPCQTCLPCAMLSCATLAAPPFLFTWLVKYVLAPHCAVLKTFLHKSWSVRDFILEREGGLRGELRRYRMATTVANAFVNRIPLSARPRGLLIRTNSWNADTYIFWYTELIRAGFYTLP